MLASRFVPMLWLRLAVLLAFTIFMVVQQNWILTAFAVVLVIITVVQLVSALRAREEERRPRGN